MATKNPLDADRGVSPSCSRGGLNDADDHFIETEVWKLWRATFMSPNRALAEKRMSRHWSTLTEANPDYWCWAGCAEYASYASRSRVLPVSNSKGGFVGAKKIVTKEFDGVVILKDWMICPDGQTYVGVKGKCSVLDNKSLVGFEATNREANFVVRVESSDGSRSINVFGCQIRSVVQGKFDHKPITQYFEV